MEAPTRSKPLMKVSLLSEPDCLNARSYSTPLQSRIKRKVRVMPQLIESSSYTPVQHTADREVFSQNHHFEPLLPSKSSDQPLQKRAIRRKTLRSDPKRFSLQPPMDINERFALGLKRKRGFNEHLHPNTDAEKKAFLKKYDFFVLIDRSLSMNFELTRGNGWSVARQSLSLIVKEAIKYDKDGIDLCFFGSEIQWIKKKIESEHQVNKIFDKIEPKGDTNLEAALKATFDTHFKRKEAKNKGKKEPQQSIILVITDGEPDNKEKVKQAIIDCTKKISREAIFQYGKKSSVQKKNKTLEIGIRFFQVGKDKKAKEFLKNLHDDLIGAYADIVSTGLIKALKKKNGVRESFINAIFD